LPAGSFDAISPIRFDIGMVWTVTVPGPVTAVLNRLSPPNRTFLTPLIY
jgi:hypothetical protein